MDEMLSSTHLSTVEGGDEAQVLASLRNPPLNFSGVHLLVVQTAIPQAKGSTRGRTNSPILFLPLDQMFRLNAILTPAKVPRRTVRLVGPDVKRCKSLKVQISSVLVSFSA